MEHYRDIRGFKLLNGLCEIVLIIAAYMASAGIRYYLRTDLIHPFSTHDMIVFFPVGVGYGLFSVFCYAVYGDYATLRIKNVYKELLRISLVQVLSSVAITTILFLIKGSQFSRIWLVLLMLLSIMFIMIKRMGFSAFGAYWCRRHQGLSKVLIIGMGRNGRRYYRGIEKVLHRECEYSGYIAPEEDAQVPGYLGTYDMIDEILVKEGPDEAVICSEMDEDILNRLLIACSIMEVKVFIIPAYNDYLNAGRMMNTYGDLNMVEITAKRADNILGVNVAVTSMESTIQTIKDNLDKWKGRYICVSNVHTVITAHDDPEYMKIQNDAVMVLPDGSPLSAYSREGGRELARRVAGPDLMRELLIRSGENDFTHFFYGSTEETLSKLRSKIESSYPGAKIVGMISPPFRELTREEDEEYVRQINEAAPDFLWVGLGAPKQEIWMAEHKGRINALMIGVGAAFDFESGEVKRAPQWMQNIKLEWLYRLMQDPVRLFRRYFFTNIKYMWLTRK